MKVFRLSICLFLLITIACGDDDPSVEEFSSIIQSGTWRITDFDISGNDKTSDFNGYTFTFASGGQVNAAEGTDTFVASWALASVNSDETTFVMSNFVDAPLQSLNFGWSIESSSDNEFELKNDNSDTVKFEK